MATALASGSLAACGGTEPRSEATVNTTQRTEAAVDDFALRDANGLLVRLSTQHGRVVLLTFVYTECPDVCPLVVETLNTVLRRLGPDRRDVRVLAVSVDPAHDTPTRVAAYARRHRLLPEFRYLLGSEAELRPVWQAYNVLAFRRNESIVDHAAPTLLIDRAGRLVRVYDPTATAAAVLAGTQAALRRG